jgi:16S rRNA (cytosine967-C5)-methyltransferase
MKPAARYQAVIELLDLSLSQAWPVDRLTQDYFKNRRYIGSKDRRFIADVFYHILRYQLNYTFMLQKISLDAELSGRILMIAHVMAEQIELAEIFSGEGYGPSALSDKESELTQQLTTLQQAAHTVVLPACLEHIEQHYSPAFFSAFQTQASLDIRVNTLKATRAQILEAFKEERLEAQPTPYAPDGIRLNRRYPLESHPIYQQGLIEIQDEGSQLISYLCAPEGTILDLCAGAGGKTLHLAALMKNQGRIVATDISLSRLQECQKRLRRASAHNVNVLSIDEASRETYDCILIDAPCSGSGTWRRHPELKNRLTAEMLQDFSTTQAALLRQASHLVKPGGKIVYVTCSFIPEENEVQIANFLKENKVFMVYPLEQSAFQPFKMFAQQGFLKLSPLESQTDGFFGAVLVRNKT